MAGVDPRARRRARRALLQALYQWQLSDADMSEIRDQFVASGSLESADMPFFEECLRGVIRDHEALDEHFAPFLDRKVSALGQIERCVLRAGTYELTDHVEVPFRVVINEWVELTKVFGAEDSHKYINGVLDKVARAVRPEGF